MATDASTEAVDAFAETGGPDGDATRCSGDPCVLATDQIGATFLAVADGVVYWNTTAAVSSCPRDTPCGGAPKTVVSPGGDVRGIAVADGFVTYAHGNAVGRCAVDGTKSGDLHPAATPYAVAVAGRDLYYSSGLSIFGCTPTLCSVLYTSPGPVPIELAADIRGYCATARGGNVRCGDPVALAAFGPDTITGLSQIAITDDSAYFSAGGGYGQLNRTDGTATYPLTVKTQFGAITARGPLVYISDGASIQTCPAGPSLDGGPGTCIPVTKVTKPDVVRMVTDDKYLFVLDKAGTVTRYTLTSLIDSAASLADPGTTASEPTKPSPTLRSPRSSLRRSPSRLGCRP